MKDKLLIITNIKKTIIRLEKFMENFSRTESTLRDNLKKEAYELLKNAYIANTFKEDRSNYQRQMLVNIKMIDFYITNAHQKKLISYKQYSTMGTHLLDLFLLTQGWIKSEKTEEPVS